jgi:hypothetical protein
MKQTNATSALAYADRDAPVRIPLTVEALAARMQR